MSDTSGGSRPADPSPTGVVRQALRRLLLSEYFVLYLTIAYFAAVAVFFPALAEPRNISNQLSNVWPLLAVAIGQTFVIIIAGIDLSLGATMGLASVVGAVVMAGSADKLLLGGSPLWGTALTEAGGLLAHHPWAPAAAMATMLLVGVLVGLVNGYFIARFRMPAFMMTLVALMFCSSLAIWITQSQNIVDLPEAFTRLGSGELVSFYFGEMATPEIRRRDILPFVTYPTLIALALAIAAHLLLSRTIFGRHVYADRQQSPGRPRSPASRSAAPSSPSTPSPASAPASPPSSIPRGSKADGRRSAAARRCSTSSAPPSSAAPR